MPSFHWRWWKIQTRLVPGGYPILAPPNNHRKNTNHHLPLLLFPSCWNLSPPWGIILLIVMWVCMGAYVSLVQTSVNFCRGWGGGGSAAQPPAGDARCQNKVVIIYISFLSTFILCGFAPLSHFPRSHISSPLIRYSPSSLQTPWISFGNLKIIYT